MSNLNEEELLQLAADHVAFDGYVTHLLDLTGFTKARVVRVWRTLSAVPAAFSSLGDLVKGVMPSRVKEDVCVSALEVVIKLFVEECLSRDINLPYTDEMVFKLMIGVKSRINKEYHSLFTRVCCAAITQRAFFMSRISEEKQASACKFGEEAEKWTDEYASTFEHIYKKMSDQWFLERLVTWGESHTK